MLVKTSVFTIIAPLGLQHRSPFCNARFVKPLDPMIALGHNAQP
jgi:hypothetical protein